MIFQNRYYPLIIIICFALVLTASCSNQSEQNSANANNAAPKNNSNGESLTVSRDDTAELNSMVILPFVPEETVFREEPEAKAPNAKKLIAVLKFTSDDAKKLSEQAAKHRQPEAVQVGAEDWFPAELIAQTQLSGDETLKGTAYGANDFMQMPYKTGRLIRVENSDYFILEVSTD